MGDGQATRLGEEAGFLSPLRRSGTGKGKKGAGRRWRRRRKSLEIRKGEEGVPEKAKLKSAGKEGRGGGKTDFPLSLSFTYFPPFLFFYGGGETTTATRDLTIFRRCSLVDRERNFLLTYIYPAHPSVYSLQIVSARKR